MKEVEKLRKKLKRTKWLTNNLNKVILGAYLPLVVLDMILLPIFPWVAVSCLSLAFVIIATLGPIYMWKYYDTEYLHFVERELTSAEEITEEKLETLSRTIEKYKANPGIVTDEKTTKSLIKELIKIKASSARALAEKQAENVQNTAKKSSKSIKTEQKQEERDCEIDL